MKWKKGVSGRGLSTQIHTALIRAEAVWSDLGYSLWVTNAVDDYGRHKTGHAVDLRLPSWWGDDPNHLADRLAWARLGYLLGPDYDVVLEVDHIHVEWDPKAKRNARTR